MWTQGHLALSGPPITTIDFNAVRERANHRHAKISDAPLDWRQMIKCEVNLAARSPIPAGDTTLFAQNLPGLELDLTEAAPAAGTAALLAGGVVVPGSEVQASLRDDFTPVSDPNTEVLACS